ncbi:mRNA interferase RelE/StbE [Thermodesulfitimonas autotrophica]|uniref:mRNA interferase RelE/StbE n=1 Tax=Thermodesulfitimonas autotrophica TaxID=1894989 RepID=A0A3N5AWV0_9THEO|nr:type II toxin-antitoxin system RelE/ParE family toxin [Thermodesulfitimonas autotrophica]RPF49489.1 mRNA interferase RelE/StbE [Thermodesulfitimonas autotrophica]
MSGKSSEFEIVFSPRAIRQLKRLERDAQLRIKEAIESGLRTFPPRGDIVKLEGFKGRYRLRVGDWRVTFRYQFKAREVHIAEIKHRREIYRRR